MAAFSAVFVPSEAAAASSLRKGPYIQDITSDSATLRLELDPPGKADVELTLPSGERRRIAGSSGTFSLLRLTSLAPKSTYRYRVLLSENGKDRPAPEGEGSFTTAPPPGLPSTGAPISFIVYGDNRSDDAAHASVVRAIAKATETVSPDFLIHTGDFVEDGANELEWQRFFEIERGLLRDRCVFASVGNHELVQPGGEAFLRYFGETGAGAVDGGLELPADRRRLYRSVRWGNVRLFFLNAMDGATTAEEKKWLTDELAKSAAEPGITFRMAVLHHGPYSSGPHGPNPRLWNAGMVDLLRENRIDLVWSGHDHIYERGDGKGLKYVVSGGGGAPLYPIRKRQASSRITESAHHFIEVQVNGQELAMVARRVDGSILDKCGFAKGGPWNCDKAEAKAEEKPATPSTPSAPNVPPSSRCGCTVPGRATVDRSWIGALAFAVMLAFRRRRHHLAEERSFGSSSSAVLRNQNREDWRSPSTMDRRRIARVLHAPASRSSEHRYNAAK
jgi:hypothetical protein